ncbi:glycoside hydrolase family 16 protein [Erythrobacter sp. THAF29]|uniref:glycoside hydrolase family 16 protein n=1 Tax=Erythrobacter sp. THAF29 TaxID=2587851 RepID=UPI0012A98CFD|nr:glycoside hydrolase family 16 protein [Erythrobacter sp. THAF29]QFT77342.1 Endo-1,3-1,4-beta-glycanase ExsH [Erythrobacter sp. THAF29]
MRYGVASLAYPALAIFAMLGLFSCDGAARPAKSSSSTTLDLTQFEPSFREDFDGLDVSEWGCLTRWIAHTPWGGDFGSARFAAPKEGFPFTTEDGILRIEAKRGEDGRWTSGMLSAWDACNSGFAQKFGYFETRAKLPKAPGFWPSFWLIGVDNRRGSPEIDVFEFRTHEPGQFSLGVIRHPSKTDSSKINATTKASVEPGMLSESFNTYGVEIAEDRTVFYLNREEIWRTETREEFHQPFYPLISFPADTSEMTDATPGSVVMEVDYVHAYKRKPLRW